VVVLISATSAARGLAEEWRGYRETLRPFHACHFVVQPNSSGLASIMEVAAVTGC
jgi:hypothetical protein